MGIQIYSKSTSKLSICRNRIKPVPATRVSQRKLLFISIRSSFQPEASGFRNTCQPEASEVIFTYCRSIRSPCLARSICSPCQPEASGAPVSHKNRDSLSARSIRSPCQPEASGVPGSQKHHEPLSRRSIKSHCQP
jgi:hypothetical protein